MKLSEALLVVVTIMLAVASAFAVLAMLGLTPWLWVVTGPLMLLAGLVFLVTAMIKVDDLIRYRRRKQRQGGISA